MGAILLQVYERGTILVQINILKAKGLNLQAEPPHIKLYWVAPLGQIFAVFCQHFLVSRFPLSHKFILFPPPNPIRDRPLWLRPLSF